VVGWRDAGGMDKAKFTAEAAVLWGGIPKEVRERILANMFCRKCLEPVRMVKYTGKVQQGDVYLKGSCAKCGQKVVRVVETSESDHWGN